MEYKQKYQELGEIFLAGLKKGVDKAISEARRLKQPIVISDKDGKVQWVYPHLDPRFKDSAE
jgi:hypothetical protein